MSDQNTDQKSQQKVTIIHEVDKIEAYLEELRFIGEQLKNIDGRDVESLFENLSFFSSLKPRVDEICCEAEMLLNNARADATEALGEEITATRLKEILGREVRFENFLNSYADKIAKTLDKRVEVIRTQLSYMKEELRIENSNRGAQSAGGRH